MSRILVHGANIVLMAFAIVTCSCSTKAPTGVPVLASDNPRDFPPTSLPEDEYEDAPIEYSNTPGPKDEDAATEFTKTKSGLKYRILRASEDSKPTAFSTVFAHYKGWLDDGTEFDSSYKRGTPSDFSLHGVIPGWTEGLQLIGKGGMIELEIPANLGYGPEGFGDSVPPNATLHFQIELFEVHENR